MVENNTSLQESKQGEVSRTTFPPPDNPIASITETNSIIDKADKIATRLEAANKKAEELVNRHEAVAARILLSGRAEAGTPAKTPEQTEREKLEADVKATLNRMR